MPPKGAPSADGVIALEDFYAFPPSRVCIYVPCREPWPMQSVNEVLPWQIVYDAAGHPLKKNGKVVKIKAAEWLQTYRRVEQLTWAPGMPDIILDKYVVDGGWFTRPGGKCLNLYRPPRIVLGDARKAGPWIRHLLWLYPKPEAKHICDWFAHRVQRPGQKLNHALALGGAQGIGKDFLLAPLREAVGPWNFHDIQPSNLFEPFNPFVKSVILRMNEAHDLGEQDRVNRFSLYERTKIYAAAPPETMRCHEKHLRPYYIPNVVGLIITTNHKADGIYLDTDDRRHFIAWSERTKEQLTDERRNAMWHWLEKEHGIEHVAAYLNQRDISGFDPYAPPPKTEAFYAIVAAGVAPEDTELGDAIEALVKPGEPLPDAFTLADLVTSPAAAGLDWLLERKSKRAIGHRLERCGYVPCRNPGSPKDGRWKIGGMNGRNQVIYVKKTLTLKQQFVAAEARRERG
jgi:hypothetical protein